VDDIPAVLDADMFGDFEDIVRYLEGAKQATINVYRTGVKLRSRQTEQAERILRRNAGDYAEVVAMHARPVVWLRR